jgi:putative membrane protein
MLPVGLSLRVRGGVGRYGSVVNTVAQIFVGLAGAFHLAVFAMESLLFKKPSTYQRFGVPNETEAAISQPWAFNQGFYNLFLAIGAIGGLIAGGDKGHAIALFACACMAGAGIVLVASNRKMARSAVLQAGPPIIALILAAVL